MQTVTSTFTAHSVANMRPLTWRVLMSFSKDLDPTIDFFTIGVSTIGGPDIIKGSGDVLQEWDKYDYTDYSNRLISMEWTRQEDQVSSVNLCMADVVLDNHDDFFTPGAGSAIDGDILPYRPIKLYAGFGNESIPALVGLTQKMPILDEKAKTATFRVMDFLSSLLNRPLDEAVLLENYSTDEALEYLLGLFGISPTQFNLDTGFNIVPFVYFDKGTKLSTAVTRLMEAEMGRFFMEENGVIRFKNRENYSNTSVFDFGDSNIIDLNNRTQDDIINVVEVKAAIRTVQPNQKFWELSERRVVPAGESIDIWADFTDPVTGADDPQYIDSATTSLFAVEDSGGFANSTDVTLTATSLFAKSFKMTFENTGSIDLFITVLQVYATPALALNPIYVREEDSTSVGKYDERILTIENDFIPDADFASSKAQIILGDYSELLAAQTAQVKGTPALQVGDPITVRAEPYTITKIVNSMSQACFKQIITVKSRTIVTYFTIGVSTIGGPDVIAP